MSGKVCPKCGFINPPDVFYCIRCGTQLGHKICPRCGTPVPPNVLRCPRCGYVFPRAPLTQYRPRLVSHYVYDPYKPRRSIIDNMKLIYNLAFKKRGPIFSPSPAVYERLPPHVLVQSGKYLNYALIAFGIGVLLALIEALGAGLGILFLPAFIVAIIPASLYLYWIYRNDRFEPEPMWLVALAFGWGAASTLIALILNEIIIPLFAGWAGAAAFVEEPAKILGVFLIATATRLKKELNDHLDGLIYGAAAGLGFGFVENILYIIGGLAKGAYLIIAVRAVTIGMHMFCTGLIGWWIGYLKVNGLPVNLTNVLPALFFSMLIHATWNTIAYLGLLGLIILIVFAVLFE